MDNNEPMKQPEHQDSSVEAKTPMDHIEMNDNLAPPQVADATVLKRKFKIIVPIILIFIAAGSALFLLKNDDTETNNTESTTIQQNSEQSGSDWIAPGAFHPGFQDSDKNYLTLRTTDTIADGEESFGVYDFYDNSKDTFRIRRFISTKDIVVVNGALDEEGVLKIIESFLPELLEQELAPGEATVELIENNLDHEVTQIGVRFSVITENEKVFHEWIVQVDYTSNVAVVFELTSKDAVSPNFDFLRSLNKVTAYLY